MGMCVVILALIRMVTDLNQNYRFKIILLFFANFYKLGEPLMLLLHWQFDSYINGFPQYADDVHVLNNVTLVNPENLSRDFKYLIGWVKISSILFHHSSMVSCQKSPTRHAYAWQIGPFWQDILELSESSWSWLCLIQNVIQKTERWNMYFHQ